MKKFLLIITFILGVAGWLAAQQVQPISIDDLNARVNVVDDTVYVVNFWATWCKPCVKELPYFRELEVNHHNDKLKVLLVSVDFPSEIDKSLIPFMKKTALKNTFIISDKNQQEYINKIDPQWSGTIPITLFIKNAKRLLVEQTLSYRDMLRYYKTIKQ